MVNFCIKRIFINEKIKRVQMGGKTRFFRVMNFVLNFHRSENLVKLKRNGVKNHLLIFILVIAGDGERDFQSQQA